MFDVLVDQATELFRSVLFELLSPLTGESVQSVEAGAALAVMRAISMLRVHPLAKHARVV